MQMNGVQLNGRAYCYEKSVPGCLGRVANLFDLTSGVARNKLLAEKPHCDGSPLPRSRSDVSRTSSPIAKDMEDKMIVSEMTRSSSTKKLEGMPVKVLIAQEMSKDLESKRKSPNVVAKLMGLDSHPQQRQQQQLLPDLAHGRSNSKGHLRNSYSEIPAGYLQQEEGFFDQEINCESHQCQEQYNDTDMYEIWPSCPKTNCPRDVSPQKGRCNEYPNEEKMALIRKKFMDAKRLSTNEKLRQTKEFQDALDVLSSNQDLFLKVLQEPNSLISHHLHGGQPIPLAPETKRITVLKPSKIVFNDKFPASANMSAREMKKSPPGSQANRLGNRYYAFSPDATWGVDETHTEPTRIVVLKPSHGRMQDVKTTVPSTLSSPSNVQKTNFFEEPGDDEAQEAREVAKVITQKMRENLAAHQRDDTLLSSVFSNGYTADESSFNKSEAEFVGNLSDSEMMSSASRHSWDYINQHGSPYACSSLSRASYFPESSVAREAKKRLSERWAMMASNVTSREQRHVWRSSSTLGEMLALSDVKKPEIIEVDDGERVQHPRLSTSCLTSNTGGDIESPGSLLRSKSLPVSSTVYSQRLDVEALDPEARKTDGPTKQTMKSSFRGKFTNLFFQRSNKPIKEKTDKSQPQDQALPNSAESSVSSGMPCDNNFTYSRSEEAQSPDLQSINRTLWMELNVQSGQCSSSQQAACSILKPSTPGTSSENQDQPSPISVLEPPFDEDGNNTLGFSDAIAPNQLGKQIAFSLGKSNLIGKSPPIGSIARTLSWDEPCTQPATVDPLASSYLSPRGAEEEGEWLFLVQSLLAAAGVDNESQLSSNLTRWHSPKSPLEPLLREKFTDLTIKEPLFEAKRRQLRSNRWLVFDCVNAALVDMTGMSSYAGQRAHDRSRGATSEGAELADRVWARMEEWFQGGAWEVEGDGEYAGDYNCLVAEWVVRKEFMGRGWADQMRLEIGIVGKEIEEKLLEELVEESVDEWTGKEW